MTVESGLTSTRRRQRACDAGSAKWIPHQAITPGSPPGASSDTPTGRHRDRTRTGVASRCRPSTTKGITRMRHVSITTGRVDVGLLRKQRNWVLTLPSSDEREGLTNLLDHLLDRAEGYPDTPAGAACDASSIRAAPTAAQRQGL
jgi:hypothetical protein